MKTSIYYVIIIRFLQTSRQNTGVSLVMIYQMVLSRIIIVPKESSSYYSHKIVKGWNFKSTFR